MLTKGARPHVVTSQVLRAFSPSRVARTSKALYKRFATHDYQERSDASPTDRLTIEHHDRNIIPNTSDILNHWSRNNPRVVLLQSQMMHILQAEGLDPMPDVTLQQFVIDDHAISLFHLNSVHSTHKIAQEWRKNHLPTKSIVAFRADKQTGGIGQRSNTWMSPPGNLYITFAFCVDAPPMAQMQFLPSLCVLETLKEYLDECSLGALSDIVQLKWINDLLLENKKICGVLTSASNCDKGTIYQLSMGVNLNFAPLESATCLRDAIGINTEIDVEDWGVRLAKTVGRHLAKLSNAGQQAPKAIIDSLQKRLCFVGQKVNIFDDKLETVLFTGEFIGITEHGFARLKLENGSLKTMMEGRMRLWAPSK